MRMAGDPSFKGYWTPPRMWEGEDAFILGGGPSLMNTIPNFSMLEGRHVVAVNDTFRLGQFEVMYFGDKQWVSWDHNWTQLQYFEGLKVTTVESLLQTKKVPDLKVVKKGNTKGLSCAQDQITWGCSSGGAAIDLVAHFGARRIFLFGFDMQMKELQHNYHESHSRSIADDIYEQRFLYKFAKMREDADARGVEIYNCTPGSALKDFQFLNPFAALGLEPWEITQELRA